MTLPHFHKYELVRRNEVNSDTNKNQYKYKHTYKCTKCNKKKATYTTKRMEY